MFLLSWSQARWSGAGSIVRLLAEQKGFYTAKGDVGFCFLIKKITPYVHVGVKKTRCRRLNRRRVSK